MITSLEQWRASIGLFNTIGLKGFSTYIKLNIIYLCLILLETIFKLKVSFEMCCIKLHSLLCANINSSFFMIVMLLLILQAGDIETNPGPSETPHDLSIVHLNIRSIRNKLDYIRDNFLDFDILCFTETHLDDAVSSEQLKLEDFEIPYRKSRTNHGGGLLMYFNSNLAHVRRPDLETYCDESIWISKNAKRLKQETRMIGELVKSSEMR